MKFEKLAVAKNAVTKLAGRTGLKIQKHSPEILLVVGTGAIIGGVVAACKETLYVNEIIEEHNDKKEEIQQVLNDENHPEYAEKEASHDLVVLTTKTGVSLAKHYAPAAGLLIFGFGCVFASYGILHKRNIALMAAYEALNTTFKDYRGRVLEEFGEAWDKHFMYNTELEEHECGCGKKKMEPKEKDPLVGDLKGSMYARFFDESSVYWKKSPELNKAFLLCQQNYANDLLRARGHLFLNEVYRMLGMPDTKAGAVVGWVLGNGNDYVDFGLYNTARQGTVDFMEGYERTVLCDFNVDGVIYDLI